MIHGLRTRLEQVSRNELHSLLVGPGVCSAKWRQFQKDCWHVFSRSRLDERRGFASASLLFLRLAALPEQDTRSLAICACKCGRPPRRSADPRIQIRLHELIAKYKSGPLRCFIGAQARPVQVQEPSRRDRATREGTLPHVTSRRYGRRV